MRKTKLKRVQHITLLLPSLFLNFRINSFLINTSERNIHRGHPIAVGFQSFVSADELSTVVLHRAGAAHLGALPPNRVAVNRQFFRGDIGLAIKEVGLKLVLVTVIADYFDAAHTEAPNRTVGGVRDKEFSWHPFIDIASVDFAGRCIGGEI